MGRLSAYFALHKIPQLKSFGFAKININKKTPQSKTGVFWYKSLTMTYFHTGIRTIIGAKSFHCPVRDGKEWDQLAMVVKQSLLSVVMLYNKQNTLAV